MADDEDDLFNEEFDVLDDDFEEVSGDDEAASQPAAADSAKVDTEAAEVAEPAEEKPPEPPTDHVVHVYEYEKFKRTIERAFTAEDAEAFATEYNRTAKPYGRFALAGKNSSKPRKTLP